MARPKSKTGTIVPKCEGYHRRKCASATNARVYEKRASLDKGPIDHKTIDSACNRFFLSRGMPTPEFRDFNFGPIEQKPNDSVYRNSK
jgi:hypothetical protein